MPESYFALSKGDQRDALGVAANASGRPADLLEKDIWVVSVLDALFAGNSGQHLTFKGGTSLSKGYGIIQRFSEDVDVTYDIRALLPEETAGEGDAIPRNRSQMKRWTKRVNHELPIWVSNVALPLLQDYFGTAGAATIEVNNVCLNVNYERVAAASNEYVRAIVQVEFGARSTGEPSHTREVRCDASPHVVDVHFPTATPRVMDPERTFWEKATLAHVYCLSGALPAERYARHWYDLMRLAATGFANAALRDRRLAEDVARHKNCFFSEKDADGNTISYHDAIAGKLRLEPFGEARERLADDYSRMREYGLFEEQAPSFDALMDACRAIQQDANKLR